MEFEWDEAKDAANRAKHGLSLADAARLDWAHARSEPDRRHDYGEDRQVALVMLDGRLMTCAFTIRGEVLRIISLRKSNIREIRRYGVQGSSTTNQ
ncbi:BrnT family toxin [Tabrizicola sp.]|uniref:BrnT family toxin n=1 Tax=Tabrizicola sp. TaxID=2005166 RepID=UPI003F3CFF73